MTARAANYNLPPPSLPAATAAPVTTTAEAAAAVPAAVPAAAVPAGAAGEPANNRPAAAAAAASSGRPNLTSIKVYDFDESDKLNIKYNKEGSSFLLPNGQAFGPYATTTYLRGLRKLGDGMSGNAYLLDFGSKKFVMKHVTNVAKVPRGMIERELDFLALVKGKWWAVQLLAAQIMPDGQAYILFPYIPGKELFDVVNDYITYSLTRLPLPRIRTIFQDVLEGLKELHALGIIHRDIKPENVWVPDDPSIRPFLLDFGLSGRITETLPTAGTRYYFRPARSGLTRNPTPNDNFYALGQSAFYINELARYPLTKLLNEGLTGDAINFSFTGGLRRKSTRRRQRRRHARSKKNTRKSK